MNQVDDMLSKFVLMTQKTLTNVASKYYFWGRKLLPAPVQIDI
jgi:hypothetical protein